MSTSEENTSQNFVSAEPDTLDTADYIDATFIEDLYRLLTRGLYCIHGSKSIDLNESLADIDEFSILFVCLYVYIYFIIFAKSNFNTQLFNY